MKLVLIFSYNFIFNCFKGYLHDSGRLILTRFEKYLVALSKVVFSICDDSSLLQAACTVCSYSSETHQDVLMPRKPKEIYFLIKPCLEFC